MLKLIKHLWLGVTLIALTSGLLLFSDLGHRKHAAPKAKTQRLTQIAIMQLASTVTLDSTVTGVMAELKAQGYVDGKTAVIRRFNASGDYTTATAMAHDILSGDYDIVITSGTPTLQTFANANREGKKIHVFCAVTDPYGSGVGITGPNPNQHPAHLVGIGTFQPVDAVIETAKKMNPALKRVGTVWDPSEFNSEACVLKARARCKALGIELVEANASNTSEVSEALRSLLVRDVEGIWIGGDIIATSAIPAIVETARKANVPVFTNEPTDIRDGALFAIGASYIEVGHMAGKMACGILHGDATSNIRVENIVPEKFALNKDVLKQFRGWTATPAMLARSNDSTRTEKVAAKPVPEPGRMYKVSMIYVTPHKLFDQAISGAKKALAEDGFVEGKNLEVTVQHANGDLSILQQIVTNANASDSDLIFAFSTPGLGAVAGRIKDKPVVFAEVTEPVGAGAGKSFTDHQANVTGAVAPAPLEGGFAWLMKMYPNIKRVGMVYTPSEPNVVTEVKIAKEFGKKYGFELVLRMANTPSEVPEALTSVIADGIDAFFYEGDNSIMSAEPVIIDTCRRHNIPILADDESEMGRGALLACGVSPFGNGHFGGKIASRVLLGENPATIPFTPSNVDEISIDLTAAKRLGTTFPADLIKEAAIVHGIATRYGRPASIAVINIANSPSLDAAEKGFFEALEYGGLVKDKDYVAHVFNAQGDISQLPQMIDAAINTAPDVIITVSTPVTIAMANRKTTIPTIFTVCCEPKTIGIEKQVGEGRITGVYEESPVGELLEMARRRCPGLSKVGIIYNSSEANSRIAVEGLRAACKTGGIALVEKSVSGVADLPEAARAVVTEGVGAILTCADNTVDTGISAVANVAQPAGIPIFATDPNLVKFGATAAIGNDYFDWGAAAGRMTVKLLAGLKMSDIPPVAFKELNEVEGKTHNAAPAANKVTSASHKKYHLYVVGLNDAPSTGDGINGIIDGLAKSGLEIDRDYVMRKFNAQGDMSTLASIMANTRADQPDMLFCISTPVLQAALAQAGDVQIVFTAVASGVKAGAGKSDVDHKPNVTGITTLSMFDEIAATIHETMPQAKKVGTLYTPAEVNSVFYCDKFKTALEKVGLELVCVPVTDHSEIANSMTALIASGVDTVCQVADNSSHSGYAFIAKKTIDAGLPLFGFETIYAKNGAVITLARDYYNAGMEAGSVGAKVLGGTDIATIPFANTQSRRCIVDLGAAKKLDLAIPLEMLRNADTITNLSALNGRPAKVAVINMADNNALEEAQKGVIEGLCDMGLVKNKDFVAKTYNGHGDYTLYPQLIETAANDQPDLIVLIGTPLIQAGAKKGSAIPTVFTVSSEPSSCGIDGAVKDGWLTGVYLNTPVDELVEMTMRKCPGIKKVGVMYNPGEYISNEAVKKMRVACKAKGLELVERSVNTPSEVSEATRVLVASDVGAIITSCDSIMNSSLPAVVNIAKPAGIPIYGNEIELLKSGADASIGYSFEDWGRAAGKMAALVLAGVKPADLPPAALSRDYLRETDAKASNEGNKTSLAAPVPLAAPQAAAPHGAWQLRVVAYADNQFVEDLLGGIKDGLKAEGLVEGRDYKLRYLNAQGDIATLSSIMNGVRADEADLLFDIATPVLQAGIQHAGNTKQVFCGVADGVTAGAGKSANDHHPCVTGISSPCDFATMIRIIRETKPGAKRIGTLYSPAEVNSVFYKRTFEKLLAENGMELVCVPVTTSMEVGEAAATLSARNIDLVCQMLDNTTHPAFALIAKRAKEAGLATYSFNNSFMSEGATLVVSYDFHETGVIAASLGARILRGENPKGMPLIADRTPQILINREAARAFGLVIPESLGKEAVSM
jgi:ABC-type uncharacterized transport system substrate-binding protein